MRGPRCGLHVRVAGAERLDNILFVARADGQLRASVRPALLGGCCLELDGCPGLRVRLRLLMPTPSGLYVILLFSLRGVIPARIASLGPPLCPAPHARRVWAAGRV